VEKHQSVVAVIDEIDAGIARGGRETEEIASAIGD
jgi:hypothetical protein